MIKKLLSRSNNDETVGVGTSMVDVVDKSAYKDDNVEKLKKELDTSVKELTTVQNRKKKNDENDEVNRLAKLRVRAYNSLSSAAKGLGLRADKTLSDNGNIILEVIKRHGRKLYDLSVNEQTARVQSLIVELETPKFKAIMDTTGLTDSFDELKVSNKSVLDSLSKRTISDAANKEVEKVQAASKKVKGLITHFIGHLNSLSIIDKSVELKDLSNRIGGLIDKANLTIHARITRENNNGDTTEVKKEEKVV